MHDVRLKQQREGKILYLVAWLGDVPVGHLSIEWTGDGAAPPDLQGIATIADFRVGPAHRSRGIGSRLMDAAEAEIRARGHPRAVVAVGISNEGARRLYERKGYRLTGSASFLSWTYLGADGELRTEGEECLWLGKPLE